MEALNINTEELKNIRKAFPGLNQEEGTITMPFVLDDLAEINYMRTALLEVIQNLCFNSSEGSAYQDIQQVGTLIGICKKLENHQIYEFVNSLINPYNKEKVQPIKQK